MCLVRSLYCCCCWHYIKTLTTTSCSRSKDCIRRVVYSKSLAICEACTTRCKKPCNSFEKIPRWWIEKKLDGYFVSVAGFELDCMGHVVVLTEGSKLVN